MPDDIWPMYRYLIVAMENRRPMTNQEIYKAVQDVCAKYRRKLPNQWEAEIRQTLQSHCKSSPQWNGKDNFFTQHERGLWSCQERSPTLDQI